MDNITHTLTGFALAESGFKHTTRLGTATLLLAANLPDIDGLSYLFGGGTDGLAFRRGWTHGVLAMVLLPPLLAAIMLAWGRLRRSEGGIHWRWLLVLAVVGVWSHPLLDLLNTYGVRLLMPFSQRWFYGDALFILDPWVWITLGIGVWWSRRRRHPAPARVALAVCAGYALSMALGSRSGAAAAERQSAGDSARRTLASPVFGNPLRRQVIRDLGDRYELGRLTLGTRWRYVPLRVRTTGFSKPGAAAAARTTAGAVFLRWARFPCLATQREADSIRVTISDLRYAGSDNRSWASVSVRVPVTQAAKP